MVHYLFSEQAIFWAENLFWVTKLIFFELFFSSLSFLDFRIIERKNFLVSMKNYRRIVFNIAKPAKTTLLRARQRRKNWESEGNRWVHLRKDTAFNKWNFYGFELFFSFFTHWKKFSANEKGRKLINTSHSQ